MKHTIVPRRGACALLSIGSILIQLTAAPSANACPGNGHPILPNTPLIGIGMNDNLSDQTFFNQVPNDLAAMYETRAAVHDASFEVVADWNSSVQNAFASQYVDPNNPDREIWKVHMHGGLFRANAITRDGYTAVACHEFGHHLGGFPYYNFAPQTYLSWAAAEGQADYFSTQSCLWEFWQEDVANNTLFATDPQLSNQYPLLNLTCNYLYSNNAEAGLCIRIGHASKSFADWLSAVTSQPIANFTTPDTSIVSATRSFHPQTQCRLDTFFSGLLCNKGIEVEALFQEESTIQDLEILPFQRLNPLAPIAHALPKTLPLDLVLDTPLPQAIGRYAGTNTPCPELWVFP